MICVPFSVNLARGIIWRVHHPFNKIEFEIYKQESLFHGANSSDRCIRLKNELLCYHKMFCERKIAKNITIVFLEFYRFLSAFVANILRQMIYFRTYDWNGFRSLNLCNKKKVAGASSLISAQFGIDAPFFFRLTMKYINVLINVRKVWQQLFKQKDFLATGMLFFFLYLQSSVFD